VSEKLKKGHMLICRQVAGWEGSGTVAHRDGGVPRKCDLGLTLVRHWVRFVLVFRKKNVIFIGSGWAFTVRFSQTFMSHMQFRSCLVCYVANSCIAIRNSRWHDIIASS
jgi:hypothetical protein